MSTGTERELALVAQIKAAQLPELQDFAIEALAAQIDLEDDELVFSAPTLVLADCPSADFHYPGGDQMQMVFAVCVPGSDQQWRRQVARDALMALRYWLPENTPYQPANLRTQRLHPVVVAGLFATYIG